MSEQARSIAVALYREILSRNPQRPTLDEWLGEAEGLITKQLDHCPSCNGAGSRWYALYGMGSCDRCKGTGKN